MSRIQGMEKREKSFSEDPVYVILSNKNPTLAIGPKGLSCKERVGITVAPFSNHPAQRFSFRTDGTILHTASGYVLDISSGIVVSGGTPILFKYHGNENQKFYVHGSHIWSSELVFTISGDNVIVSNPIEGADHQSWSILLLSEALRRFESGAPLSSSSLFSSLSSSATLSSPTMGVLPNFGTSLPLPNPEAFPTPAAPLLGEGEGDRLLNRFCPLFYFHKDEKFFPTSIKTYLASTKLVYRSEENGMLGPQQIKETVLLNEGEVTVDRITSLSYGVETPYFSYPFSLSPSSHFQMIPNDSVAQGEVLDGECVAPIYGAIVSPNAMELGLSFPFSATDLAYFIFYARENTNLENPIYRKNAFRCPSERSGVWHSVVIRLSADRESILAIRINALNEDDPKSVWLFPSQSSIDDISTFDFDPVTKRPVLYISRGRHMMYPSPSPSPSSSSSLSLSYSVWRGGDVCGNGRVWKPFESELRDISNSKFLSYRGLWGPLGSFSPKKRIEKRLSGGPAPSRVYTCKITWVYEGGAFVGTSVLSNVSKGRATPYVQANYGGGIVTWSIWDALMRERPEIECGAFLAASHACVTKIKGGFLSFFTPTNTPDEDIYIGDFRYTPAGEGTWTPYTEVLYVCANTNEAPKVGRGAMCISSIPFAPHSKDVIESAIEVILTRDVERVWDDEGTSAIPVSMTVFHPRKVNGWYPVGSVAQIGQGQPFSSFAVLVRTKEGYSGNPVIADPIDYRPIWNSASTWAKQPVFFWLPVPPIGYVSLGLVATNTKKPPQRGACVVVHESIASLTHARFSYLQSRGGSPLWNDQFTNSKFNITLWEGSNFFHRPLSFSCSSSLSSAHLSTFMAFSRHRPYPLEPISPSLLLSSIHYEWRSEEKDFGAFGPSCIEEVEAEGGEEEEAEGDGRRKRRRARLIATNRFVYATPYEWKSCLSVGSVVKTMYYESDMDASDCDVVFVKTAEFDEAEILRMLKGFLSSTLRMMSVGDNKFPDGKRDYRIHDVTHIPVYCFTVRVKMTKVWLSAKEKRAGGRMGVGLGAGGGRGQEVVGVELEDRFATYPETEFCLLAPASRDPECRKAFHEMRHLGLLNGWESDIDCHHNPDSYTHTIQEKENHGEKEKEKEREKEKLDPSLRLQRTFFSEVREIFDDNHGIVPWREAWEREVEDKAIAHTISYFEKNGEEERERTQKDMRYTVVFSNLLPQLVLFPVLKCSYLWESERPTVWVDGRKEKVFTTDSARALRLPLSPVPSPALNTLGFLRGKDLLSLLGLGFGVDTHFLSVPNPPPKATGWITLQNRGGDIIIVSGMKRESRTERVGTSLCLMPGEEKGIRFQAVNLMIKVDLGDPSHLHVTTFSLTDAESHRNSHRNYLSASQW